MANVRINTSIETAGDHTRNDDLDEVVTIAVPGGANIIMMQAETQAIRYTLDGTTPTDTVGFLLAADTEPRIVPVPVNGNVKVLEATAGGVLNYQFLRV